MPWDNPIRLTQNLVVGMKVYPSGTYALPMYARRPLNGEDNIVDRFRFLLEGSSSDVPLEQVQGHRFTETSWDDPAFLAARKASCDWRRADLDTARLTAEASLGIIAERLADLHEVILGWRPRVSEDQPVHVTVAQWMPILSDYEVFVRRVQAQGQELLVARDRVNTFRAQADRKAQERDRKAQERDNAVYTLQQLRAAIQQVNTFLSQNKGDG